MKRLRRSWVRDRSTVLMASPAVVLVAVFVAVPLLLSIVFSFTDWQGQGFEADFVGLDNYLRIFMSPSFLRALYVTVFIALVSTVLLNVLGLGLAALLSSSSRLNTFYRSVFFFPMVLAPVIVGFLWKTLLDYRGSVNQLLAAVGVAPIPFLGDSENALLSVTGVIVWQLLGFNMVLYIAGLQNIPASVIEAATIDGAGRFKTFWFVTVPMLAPVITINVVSVFIFNMREFDRIKAITDGGPGGATQTLAYKIITEAFSLGYLGRGSAWAVLLVVGVGLIAGLLIWALRRNERAQS